jgi:hypothetical protein
MFKEDWIRLILVSALILSFVADVITFMYNPSMQVFEINPIFIWLKSVWPLLLIKTLCVAALAYIIYHPSKVKPLIYFSIVLSVLYLTAFQCLGAYSNWQIVVTNPAPSEAMAPAQATKTYFSVGIVLYLIPMAFAMLAFWLHENLYYESFASKLGRLLNNCFQLGKSIGSEPIKQKAKK